MTLTPLEAILTGGGIALMSSLLMKIWDNSMMVSKNDCSQHRAACNPILDRMEKMERLLESQCKLIRLLLSKAGISVEEQIRLERETLSNGLSK